jgi:hypothetical protein
MINIPKKVNIVLTNIKQLSTKELKIRKKIDIYVGNNIENQESVILHIVQKSRFLQKDVDKVEDILKIIQNNQNEEFSQKSILIESPLCSKAKAKLEALAWSVFI